MHTLLPYLAGIGCSLCYGLATILEQAGARNHKAIRSLHPSHFVQLFRQFPYISGIVLDLLGWVLFLAAARSLPLFLDLSFVTASVMVTAVLAHLFFHIKNTKTEVIAISVITLGLILLGIAAKPSAATNVSHAFRLALEFSPVIIAVVGLYSLKINGRKVSAMMLAICAGLSFGATGLVSRIIHIQHYDFHTIVQPLTAALVCYGVLGMLLLAAALQKDNLNRINSVMYASELTIPSILGILYLGDSTRPGLWILFIVGFVMIFIGTLAIARSAPHDVTARNVQ